MRSPFEVYTAQIVGKESSDIQDHMHLLCKRAKGNIFEIGVRGGISTAALLVGATFHDGHLWSVDIDDCSQLYDIPAWTFIRGNSSRDSERILSQLPPVLDVLFIDSDHSLEMTRRELQLYAPRVKKGGVILAHDTDLAGAGVRQALDEYAQQLGKTPVYHTGSHGLGELVP